MTMSITDETRRLALSSFKRPVHYDRLGHAVMDADNSKVLDVRGWGRIQYMDRPEERHDAVGELLAWLINQQGIGGTP